MFSNLISRKNKVLNKSLGSKVSIQAEVFDNFTCLIFFMSKDLGLYFLKNNFDIIAYYNSEQCHNLKMSKTQILKNIMFYWEKMLKTFKIDYQVKQITHICAEISTYHTMHL